MAKKTKTFNRAKFGPRTMTVPTFGFNVTVPLFDVQAAVDLLVNARLQVDISHDPNAKGDVEGQQTMPAAATKIKPLRADVDVHSLTIHEDRIVFRMVFARDQNGAHLDELAYKVNRLNMRRMGDATEAEDDSEAA